MSIIENNLFDSILVDPAKAGCQNLYIVTGYASSAMAFRHINLVKQIQQDIRVKLIVGMCRSDGLSVTNHLAFRSLMEDTLNSHFECSYVVSGVPVHSKGFAWYNGETAVRGFIGSANYSQNAFKGNQREIMTEADPQEIRDYFDRLSADSIYCNHGDAENNIRLYHRQQYNNTTERHQLALGDEGKVLQHLIGLERVRLSFLMYGKKEVSEAGSGLNWGYRTDGTKRNLNQSYIRVHSPVNKSDFFPPRAIHFTVVTDDGKTLNCVVAQENDKAIETTNNNSLMGEYFRNRLGLSSGARVKKEDLEKYGRTHVDFYKIDDETYHMDFSV